jgi:TrmH family RNA methyltransferase
MIITSKTNQWIKILSSIKAGKELNKNFFVVEGYKVIELLQIKYRIEALFLRENSPDRLLVQPTIVVSKKLWPQLSDLKSPPDTIAILEKPEPNQIDFNQDTIILDNIQDPGNLGSIMRSAAASGWKQIVCSKGCADPYSLKTLRASSGALSSLNLITGIENREMANLLNEQKNSIQLFTAEAGSNTALKDISITDKTRFLILGNEGHGISEVFRGLKQITKLSIPQDESAVESLNVGVAAALLMYKLKGLL